ncbi:hypothetical protein K3175_07805 [Qipengyuania sp. GH1]|uniref:hypothetical protein n=1 Tax=Qipengyuania aestuarii TaxID=2867241 RepID=UPI001C86ED6B|nr:hypothetical protein [Qipengyuania aestuarii]MBX7535562.1 hypothetical protein [Qipengyuania aestuarii]
MEFGVDRNDWKGAGESLGKPQKHFSDERMQGNGWCKVDLLEKGSASARCCTLDF